MKYISVTEAAVAMKVPVRVLRDMCERGMIERAARFGRIWAIPDDVCRDALFQTQSYPWAQVR